MLFMKTAVRPTKEGFGDGWYYQWEVQVFALLG
jgi:hypothetical protein